MPDIPRHQQCRPFWGLTVPENKYIPMETASTPWESFFPLLLYPLPKESRSGMQAGVLLPIVLFRASRTSVSHMSSASWWQTLKPSVCTFHEMSCKPVTPLAVGKTLILSVVDHFFSITAKYKQASSPILLKNTDQRFCFILACRLLVNLFSGAAACWKI